MSDADLIPVSLAAVTAGVSRERLIRFVQRQQVRGELRDGRWLVDRGSLLEYVNGGTAPIAGAGAR